MKKYVFIFVLLLLWPSSALAQQPLVVSVDRTELSTDEQIALTIELNSANQNQPTPVLPPLTGFNIVGQSSASQVSIVNGVVNAKLIYNYRLQPTQTGDLTIPSITQTVDGQSYTSEPIAITVAQGAAPTATPPPISADTVTELNGQDFFAEGVVDNAAPYLGQQLTYTFRFYQAVRLAGQAQYDAPSFTGFWNEQQPDQKQYLIQTAGRTYQVTELNTLLFPTIVGPTEIEPAQLSISGLNGPLGTQAVPVNVLALPDNAPDDFNGAVGQFTIAAEIDQTETQVNEPLTLRVTLGGTGNIPSLPDPIWPEIDGWRAFDDSSSMNSAVQEGLMGGSRVYQRLLVPGRAGDFSLPPISYSYFDPASGQYQTIATESIAVTIGEAEAEAPITPLAGVDKQGVTRIGTDIRYLKAVPTTLIHPATPLTERTTYWLAWGVPFLLLAINLVWTRRLGAGLLLMGRSQARREAQRLLNQAKQGQLNPYDACDRAIRLYLSDKLGKPVTGLTERELRDLLQEQRFDDELQQQIIGCLNECDLGRFVLNNADQAHEDGLLKRVERLLERIAEAWRSQQKMEKVVEQSS